MKQRTSSIAELVVIGIAVFVPLLLRGNLFLLNLMVMSCVYIILTTSLRLAFITGIWNMAQAAFYSLGAYGIVFLTRYLHLNYWVALLLCPIIGLVVALMIGPLTLRVKGVYFCILSLSFVEVVRLTYINVQSATERTMRAIAPPTINIANLVSIDFGKSRMYYYYFALLLAVVTIAILKRIEFSRLGKTLKAIQKNELLARSFGINSVFYKVVAFCICSAFAGLAGGLFASYNIVVSPTSFTAWLSMMFIVQIVVGGMKSIYGPIVGTVLLTILPEYLPLDPIAVKIVYGVLLVVIVSLLPDGLVSLPARILSRARGGTGPAAPLGERVETISRE